MTNKQQEEIHIGLGRAVGLFRSGRMADAEHLLTDIHSRNKKNAEVLGLIATIRHLAGDRKNAKKLWKQSLRCADAPQVFFFNLHAFLRSLFMDESLAAAEKQAMRKLPDWPASMRPGLQERDMLIELADMLSKAGQLQSAEKLLADISRALPDDLKVKASLGLVQMLEGDFESALNTLSFVDQSIQPNVDLSLLVRIYQCAAHLQMKELMQSVRQRAVAAFPVYVAPEVPGQSKNILVLNREPKLDETILNKEEYFFRGNYPSQLANRLSGNFRFLAVFSEVKESRDAGAELQNIDLVLNNHAIGEAILHKSDLSLLSEYVDSFGAPVINHPQRVVLTTRDKMASLVREIGGVIAPKTILTTSHEGSVQDLADEIEEQFSYPLIIRTLFHQQGKGMQKVMDRESLERILSEAPEKFYVTQYVDSQHASCLYRKIRAAVVGDELFIVRVDYDTFWNIHGRKSEQRIAFYKSNQHLLEEESRICSDPQAELGSSVMRSLEEIRQRVPLDIFGIDFDVTESGELLFFEANAAMNLLSTAGDASINHPVHVEEQLIASMRRYLQSRVQC